MSEQLTPEIAALALELATPAIQAMMDNGVVKRPHLHVTIGVRVPEPPDNEPPHPHYREVTRRAYGYYGAWEHDYDVIAGRKAEISGRTGLPSRVVQLFKRHLLRRGDIKYWGSAVEDGIVVAASGVQPWFDEAISKIILAIIMALIEEAAETEKDKDGDYYGAGLVV